MLHLKLLITKYRSELEAQKQKEQEDKKGKCFKSTTRNWWYTKRLEDKISILDKE